MAKSPIIFTLDLEDHLGQYSSTGSYRDNTLRILDLLDSMGVRGTIFTVGRVAEVCPELVRHVVARGHELGCHSWQHTPLDREDPETFRQETRRAKDLLEQGAGVAVLGFRAPVFSLIATTLWALPVIRELGFTYSSSVMPAPSPLYGFPGAPRHPFLWPNGLIEFPCPVAVIGPVAMPYLGGIYLRYLPAVALDSLLKSANASCLWTYIHPYDFDPAEPFVHMPGTTFVTSALLWMNRRNTGRKIQQILDGRAGTPFRDLVAQPGFRDTLETFHYDRRV